MRWFRFYDEAVNDPKIIKLSDDIFRAWVNLLCVASKHEGRLPAIDDVAIILRVKKPRAAAIIAELVSCGLLDKDETGFAPHNWNGRQYKSDVSTDRVKRFRNGKRNVSETPPETEADTEQKQKKKETREDALSYDFEFADFWNVWPNKVGKPAALKAFLAARKRAGLDVIVEGVFAYIRDKPPDRSWLNPATFLNQNRWEDQPAQVQHGRTQETRQSLPEAARRLAEQGLSFGPKPELPTLRSITGGADVRLLPQSGGERSGDLRGSSGGGPERLPDGGDRLHHGPEDGSAEQIAVVAERVRG